MGSMKRNRRKATITEELARRAQAPAPTTETPTANEPPAPPTAPAPKPTQILTPQMAARIGGATFTLPPPPPESRRQTGISAGDTIAGKSDWDHFCGLLAAAVQSAGRSQFWSVGFIPGPGLVVVNPPYGIRVGDKKPLRNLFAQLGNVSRSRAAGWRLAMLSADRDLERQVQLPFTEQWKSTNGGIPVRLITAEVPIDGK